MVVRTCGVVFSLSVLHEGRESRFDVYVYVVPYEYCYECYEDV